MAECLNKLFGNSNTRERLASAVKLGTLPHALLICGPEGSGKHTLALELSAAINCESSGADRALPCHSCNTCKRIAEGQFSDVKILKKDNSKATIGVEQVRDFREDMFLSPSEAEAKVYLIENAEALTGAAQNALLKVIEEPPEATYIFLLANSTDNILSTIKSRAQYIQMQRFTPEEIDRYLTENIQAAMTLKRESPEEYATITLLSSGVIGAAIGMLDEKALKESSEYAELVTSLLSALQKRTEFSKLYEALSSLPTARAEFKRILELTLCAMRDIFTVKGGIKAPLLFFRSEEAAESYSGLNSKRLMKICRIITDALADVDKNILIPTLITDIALSISQTA